MREMKDSGVAWIGEIPETWEIKRIKEEYSLQAGFTPDTKNESYYDENGYDWVTISDIEDGKTIFSTKKKVSQKYITEFSPSIIPKGSLLYSFKLSVGQTAFAGKELYSNEAIAAFFPDESISLSFLRYSSFLIVENAETNIYGAKILNRERIKNALVVYPPLSDQQKIAAHLDRKCTQIDALIANAEQQIEKLKAYKQSVITETVTKGLDPDVEMKNSGIDWIGGIPENWIITKIKYAADVSRGLFNHRPRNDARFYNGAYPFIQTGDVARAIKYITEYSQTLNENGIKVSKQFPKGTLTMTIAANVGDVAILGFDAYFPDSVVGFIPHSDCHGNYLYYIFRAMKDVFVNASIMNTQLNLNVERVKNLYMPFATTISEQVQIADYLDKKCEQIDRLIAIKQQKIEKLQQYKKSLIYEYVTGKKGVE